jgi:NTP pyrophosphatase (non-canonical NTP hydrolase)
MKKKNLEIVKGLVKTFGKESALDKLQEETTELALALHQYSHCDFKTNKKERLDDVYKELADVKNAIRAVETFLNARKINRLQNKKLKKKKLKYLTNDNKQKRRSLQNTK